MEVNQEGDQDKHSGEINIYEIACLQNGKMDSCAPKQPTGLNSRSPRQAITQLFKEISLYREPATWI